MPSNLKYLWLTPLFLVLLLSFFSLNTIKDSAHFQETVSHISMNPRATQFVLSSNSALLLPEGIPLERDVLYKLPQEEFVQSAWRASAPEIYNDLASDIKSGAVLDISLQPLAQSIAKELSFPVPAPPRLILSEQESQQLTALYKIATIACPAIAFLVLLLVTLVLYLPRKKQEAPIDRIKIFSPFFLLSSLLAFLLSLALHFAPSANPVPLLFLEQQTLVAGKGLLLLSLPLFLFFLPQRYHIFWLALAGSALLSYLLFPLYLAFAFIIFFFLCGSVIYREKALL